MTKKLELLKKVGADAPGYLPTTRFIWEEFRERNAGDDVTPVRVKLRASITNRELQAFRDLEPSSPIEDLHALLAPFVADWDVLYRDPETNDVYAVTPPAEGGPDAFLYVPRSLVFAIQNTIIGMPFRTLPKALSTPAVSTDEA